MEIRQAIASDSSVLADLGATTFYDTFHAFHTKEDMDAYILSTYSKEAIIQNLQNPKVYYALVYDEKKPVGYLKLILDKPHEHISGKTIELEKIYVLKQYRGSQVGKQLMDHALVIAKQHQYEILFLGVWEENHRAVAFYKKYGFEVFATRTFKLGNNLCDDFIMKLSL
jgi:ribosomal protein S18 acetylase RimI-like enzyme